MATPVNEATVAIIAAASAAAGGLLLKATESLIRFYKARQAGEEKGQGLLFREWQKIIDAHQAKILRAEEHIEKLQREHVDCLKENAVLRSRVDSLEGHVAELQQRSVELSRETEP